MCVSGVGAYGHGEGGGVGVSTSFRVQLRRKMKNILCNCGWFRKINCLKGGREGQKIPKFCLNAYLCVYCLHIILPNVYFQVEISNKEFQKGTNLSCSF